MTDFARENRKSLQLPPNNVFWTFPKTILLNIDKEFRELCS